MANYEPKTGRGKIDAAMGTDGRKPPAIAPGACLKKPNGVCAKDSEPPKKKRS